MPRREFPRPKPYESERFVMRPMRTLPLAWRTYHWTKQRDLFQYLAWKAKGWSFLKWYIHLRKRNNNSSHCHAIISKENGEFVGMFITYIDKKTMDRAETTTIVGEEQWRGKGVQREVKKANFAYCFEYLKLRKLGVSVAADNHASIKNNLAVGFVKEGVLREDWLLPGGRRTDKIKLGIFLEEWLQSRV